MKKILAIVLSLVMVISAMQIGVFAVNPVTPIIEFDTADVYYFNDYGDGNLVSASQYSEDTKLVFVNGVAGSKYSLKKDYGGADLFVNNATVTLSENGRYDNAFISGAAKIKKGNLTISVLPGGTYPSYSGSCEDAQQLCDYYFSDDFAENVKQLYTYSGDTVINNEFIYADKITVLGNLELTGESNICTGDLCVQGDVFIHSSEKEIPNSIRISDNGFITVEGTFAADEEQILDLGSLVTVSDNIPIYFLEILEHEFTPYENGVDYGNVVFDYWDREGNGDVNGFVSVVFPPIYFDYDFSVGFDSWRAKLTYTIGEQTGVLHDGNNLSFGYYDEKTEQNVLNKVQIDFDFEHNADGEVLEEKDKVSEPSVSIRKDYQIGPEFFSDWIVENGVVAAEFTDSVTFDGTTFTYTPSDRDGFYLNIYLSESEKEFYELNVQNDEKLLFLSYQNVTEITVENPKVIKKYNNQVKAVFDNTVTSATIAFPTNKEIEFIGFENYEINFAEAGAGDLLAESGIVIDAENSKITVPLNDNGFGDYYLFIQFADKVVKGDMNGDGSVSVEDANILANIIARKASGDFVNMKVADMNDDGVLDINDVVLIIKATKSDGGLSGGGTGNVGGGDHGDLGGGDFDF